MKDMEWVLKWFRRAQDDYAVACHLFQDFHPKPLEIICYQCQQAVEKALKSYLIYQEYEFPMIHDLRKLCVLCAEFDIQFKDYSDDCADLIPYATQARYPDDREVLEPETESALHKTSRVMDLIAGLICPT